MRRSFSTLIFPTKSKPDRFLMRQEMAHRYMPCCAILATRLLASFDKRDGAMFIGKMKAVDRRFLDMEGYGGEPLVAHKQCMVN